VSRYSYYEDYFPPSKPIQTDDGLKTRSRRGKIGQSWWAERWIAAMEQLVDVGRLRRGRSYARSGQVLSIEERDGGVTARVQGSRPKPYKVTIQVKPLSDAQWEAVIAQMSEQAIFAAQLLAGEMPPDIEDAFAAAKASLFPTTGRDLTTNCTCPDDANPCKHIAATHYILGEQFDEDPFLLFRLRGRTQEQIMEALRSRRAAETGVAEGGPEYETGEEPEQFLPLEETLDVFWQPAAPLETSPATIRRPAVALPLLKRLGPPAFLPDHNLAELLGPAYELITREALRLAFAGDEDG
jgi:uncharacterized Zn finger protein